MTGSAEFEVRRLFAGDLPVMRDLLRVFGEAFDEIETFSARKPGDDHLKGLLGKADFVALAALERGEVIGGLAAYELQKFEQERSEYYIYDLAVREASRRRGVATSLIEELRRIAAAKGVYVIFVQADYGDDPAIGLYTKLGIREDVMHFDIAVPGAS
jgi:aminoglycoside 3-N-acetyltransferase I